MWHACREDDEYEAFECSICHVQLLTGHYLDLHLLEVHDSFFAAQAARRTKVCGLTSHVVQLSESSRLI